MTGSIIVFEVALKGQKGIWRKIAMKGSHTLDDLHEMIFDAFDRDDEHLYSFFFPKQGVKNARRIMQESQEFTHPAACDDSPFGSDAGDATKTKLSSLSLKPKQLFYYLFDFGDEWWHEITVEDTEAVAEKGQKYPYIVEKKGKSPPQYPDDEEYDDKDDKE